MEFFLIMTWGSDVVPQLNVGWALNNFLPTGWRLVEDNLGAHTIFLFTEIVGWVMVTFFLSDGWRWWEVAWGASLVHLETEQYLGQEPSLRTSSRAFLKG